MEPSVLEAQRKYWNGHFVEERPLPPPSAPWIDELIASTSHQLNGHVLEIGCGRGHDTHYLIHRGCTVTSFDLSWYALQNLQRTLPPVHLVNGALPDPLPFRDTTFAYVIAGLSLHYFQWHDTLAIIGEIARVLQPGGVLLFRVNSTEDVAHGAGRGEDIEPNLYLQAGRYKRFFTEEMCRELFDSTWKLERLLPRTEHEGRFADPKPTWMGISSINRG